MTTFRDLIEGADSDRRVRMLAREVWNSVLASIDRRKFAGTIRPLDGMNHAVLSIDLPREIRGEWAPLQVMIGPKRSGWNAMNATRKSNKKIPVIALAALDYEPNRLHQWPTSEEIKGQRRYFIHEFIHMMDRLRMTPSFMEKERDNIRSGKKDYYASEVEFNAYFQDAADDLERRWNALPEKGLKRIALEDPKVFQSFFLGHDGEFPFKKMPSKLQRHARKRIYKFWRDFRGRNK